jgi:hypothetical protein
MHEHTAVLHDSFNANTDAYDALHTAATPDALAELVSLLEDRAQRGRTVSDGDRRSAVGDSSGSSTHMKKASSSSSAAAKYMLRLSLGSRTRRRDGALAPPPWPVGGANDWRARQTTPSSSSSSSSSSTKSKKSSAQKAKSATQKSKQKGVVGVSGSGENASHDRKEKGTRVKKKRTNNGGGVDFSDQQMKKKKRKRDRDELKWQSGLNAHDGEYNWK